MLFLTLILCTVQLKGNDDTHAGNIAKIYRFFNYSCNVRHHASLPAGEPTMTWMVKVDKIKYVNKYFALLHPAKRSSP